MKKTGRFTIFFLICMLLAFISISFTKFDSLPTSGSAKYTSGALILQATATPQPQADKSEVGSTDFITATSFVITAIIIIPIVLKRKDWSQP